jgi:hypothetical protein
MDVVVHEGANFSQHFERFLEFDWLVPTDENFVADNSKRKTP